MKRLAMVVLAVVVAVSGCGGKAMIAYNGMYYPVAAEVATVPEIDSQMRKDGVVLLEDLAAQKAKVEAEKKKDYTMAVNVANAVVDVSYFGVQFISLPGVLTVGSSLGNIAMSYFSALDTLKLIGDIVENKNTIKARIRLNRVVEIERFRNSYYYNIVRFQMEQVKFDRIAQQMEKCKWPTYFRPVIKKNSGLMYQGHIVGGVTGNFSTVGNEFFLVLKYPDETSKLPADDPCSIKSAELCLAEQVNGILENTAYVGR